MEHTLFFVGVVPPPSSGCLLDFRDYLLAGLDSLATHCTFSHSCAEYPTVARRPYTSSHYAMERCQYFEFVSPSSLERRRNFIGSLFGRMASLPGNRALSYAYNKRSTVARLPCASGSYAAVLGALRIRSSCKAHVLTATITNVR